MMKTIRTRAVVLRVKRKRGTGCNSQFLATKIHQQRNETSKRLIWLSTAHAGGPSVWWSIGWHGVLQKKIHGCEAGLPVAFTEFGQYGSPSRLQGLPGKARCHELLCSSPKLCLLMCAFFSLMNGHNSLDS